MSRPHKSSFRALVLLPLSVAFGCSSAESPGANHDAGAQKPDASSFPDALPDALPDAADGDATPTADASPDADGPGTTSFEDIKQAGLSNAVYPDADHYVAEYLFQNPNVCYWALDEQAKTVSPLAMPVPGANAIDLPAPSGGDDTAALEAIVNKKPGQTFVGKGTYKVNGLSIKVPTTIFDMPMEPAPGTTVVVEVLSKDVRIYNSPIDAKEMASVHFGWRVEPGSHDFHLVSSGFTNMSHKNNNSGSGLYLRGSRDYHIACNDFSNIINDTKDPNQYTARANAIWLNGGNKFDSEGGYIVNNTSENLQSNGKGNGGTDAEFFTSQSHTGHKGRVRIFANRCVNAGKRLTKWQTGGGLALSNFYHWRDRQGPLGPRTQLALGAVHFGHADVSVSNNRFKIEGKGEFTYGFIMTASGTDRSNNVHFDGNDIEVIEKPTASHYGRLIVGRNLTVADNISGLEATNSSARNNRVHGPGAVSNYYWFGAGWDDKGKGFDTSGNVFSVPAEQGEFH